MEINGNQKRLLQTSCVLMCKSDFSDLGWFTSIKVYIIFLIEQSQVCFARQPILAVVFHFHFRGSKSFKHLVKLPVLWTSLNCKAYN